MAFPIELAGAIGSAVAGFIFKQQANTLEVLKQTHELQIQKEMTADQLANSASKRGSQSARKILAFVIVGTFVLGLFVYGLFAIWKPDAVVSLVSDQESKKLLWGLFEWGGGVTVTEARGFVLPDWTGWVISIVVGFFFGTGSAKPAR